MAVDDNNQRRKKPPTGADQQALPFDVEYRERFALLDAIDCQRTPFTKRTWQNVRTLLKEIHRVDTTGRGCFKKRKTIVEESELSRRQFDAAVKAAETEGLIFVERRCKGEGRGRDSNVMRVIWPAVASLQRRMRGPTAQLGGPMAQLGGPMAQSVPIIRINSDGSSERVSTGTDHARAFKEERARACARKIAGSIRPANAADARFIVRVAWCFGADMIPEYWWADALAGVRATNPGNRLGCFRRILQERAANEKSDFEAILRAARPGAECNSWLKEKSLPRLSGGREEE
jgi:hypothetical protein